MTKKKFSPLSIITLAVSVVVLVYYCIQSNIDHCFQISIVSLLGFSIVCLVLNGFKKLDFLPMLSATATGVCFGLMLFYALPTFSDIWNNVNFIGGNATAYFVYLGGLLAAFIICLIPCFKRDA